jgi:poly(3-hydroxybutyrate) depolymerase
MGAPGTGPATAGKSGSAGGGGTMTMAGAGGMGATAGMGGTSNGTPNKSAGCGMAPPGSDTSVMVGGATGPYILDLPSGYDNNHAYPLIIVWHGAGVTNTAFHDYLNMHMVVGNDGIVVTPECTDGSTWPQDASYFDALLEHFSSKYCIDKSKVFSTGHSMGGMHTALLACLRADKLRGDAVLAAPHSANGCVKGNMGVMMSVGMSDFVASYMTEFAYWTQYGGCDMNMKMPVDPMTFTSGTPEESGHCDEYGGCAAGTPVRTCTFDGGHEIPGWVAGAVWSFFKKLM